jgi:hypothetical protein
MQNVYVFSIPKFPVLSNSALVFPVSMNCAQREMDRTIFTETFLVFTLILNIYDSTYRKTKCTIRKSGNFFGEINKTKILHTFRSGAHMRMCAAHTDIAAYLNIISTVYTDIIIVSFSNGRGRKKLFCKLAMMSLS